MRKYLEDLSEAKWIYEKDSNDERNVRFRQQRAKWGFDERETWALDSAMIYNLYERVKAYKEIASQTVDIHACVLTYNDKEYHQDELIDVLLDLIREWVKLSNWDNKYISTMEEIWKVWAILSPAMWW